MFQKLRYGIVILAGILIVIGTAVITAPRANDTTENKEAEAEAFEVSDFAYGLQGNDSVTVDEYGIKVPDSGVRGENGAGLRLQDSPSLGAGETLGHGIQETADPSDAADGKASASNAAGTDENEVSEGTTAEEHYFGLRAYFRDKLIIDTDKVEYWLNVREEPDDDSRVVSVLYADDVVTVTDTLDHWYVISGDGYSGYVSADYVLTGMDVYDTLVDSVAYAVMVSGDEAMFYAEPDDTGVRILAGQKGETFRTVGMSGDYYEVQVISDVYDTLFVHKDDVILYYLFLGRGNDNELSDAYEAYFGTLEISDNLERSTEIKEEAESDWAAYESYLESSSEAVAESASAAKAAAAASAAQAKVQAQANAQAAATQAQSTGQAQYLGTFTVTHYCHCQKCCGVWGSNDPNYTAYGSSGMKLQDDYTVAVNPSVIPYGTRLLINGKEYIAADDAGSNVIDIYRSTHDAALAGGCYTAEVYILP